jgi:hypothetical protein
MPNSKKKQAVYCFLFIFKHIERKHYSYTLFVNPQIWTKIEYDERFGRIQ